MTSTNDYRFVKYLWNDAEAEKLDPVGRLVYRSNLLGSDPHITNTGGGNTSSKIPARDPLDGREVDVLWVKGSGGDLRTSTRDNFASLYLHKLLDLRQRYLAAQPRGPKSAVEDEMVGLYPHGTFNLNPRPASIDTPLHAFISARCVDHTHPNAVIAVAAAQNGQRLTREIYGDEILWSPWQRPGFDLGLLLADLRQKDPQAKGVILGQHGLINWADDDKSCYQLTLSLIEKAARFIQSRDKGKNTFGGAVHQALSQRHAILAEILPWLRGRLSEHKRMIATVQTNEPVLQFVNSREAPRLAELGTSCPDHFLRTKIKPLHVPWNPQTQTPADLREILETSLAKYRHDYAQYYQRCKRADSPPMRDANPTVILIPGLGMIAWGKDKNESRITAEFYNCAIEVMRGAEAIDRYVALPQQEAFDIEYWSLEEAKLKRMPPEKELARRVIAVVGAGSGIGRQVAHRLARDGAHVACVDLDRAAAEATAKSISDSPALAIACDVTSRQSIHATLEELVLAYGGLDGIAVTAGVFVPPDPAGHIPDEKWDATFAVNVKGMYLVADEAAKIFARQNLPASIVLTTSVNAVVVKKGSLAYDTSKAAANHLVRELAVELAPLIRVNGVAPATVVQGSALFPRDRVIASLTKYAIPFDPNDSTESLREKLAAFYADRTLLKSPITPADQAEAFFLLLSDRLTKTTGQILSVDGGLTDAFLR